MPSFSEVKEVRDYAYELLSRQQIRLDKYIRIEQLARLEKWVLEEVSKRAPEHQDDWPTVTLNEPKTLYNAIRRACGKYPISHRIWLPSLPSDEELDEINRHERLLIGHYSDVDLLRRRRSEGRLQTDANWFISHRGGVIIRPLIEREAPFTPFRTEIWDPLATVFEPGSTGLAYIAHFRLVAKGVLEEDFDREDDSIDRNGNVAIADIWWKGEWQGVEGVFNIIVGPKTILKGPSDGDQDGTEDWGKEPFEDIPVYVSKIGSPAEQKPAGVGASSSDAIGDKRLEDQWETIFDTNEMMYAWLNRIASLYGLIIRQGAIGPWSVDRKTWNDFKDKLGPMFKPFGIIPTTDVGPVQSPQIADAAKEFFAFLQGAEQRGGVPYASYGMVPFQLSGFGINQLQGGIEIAALPVSQTLEDMYWLADDEILRQARKLKGKFKVKGTDNAGKPFLEDIAGAKLDKNYIVQTSVKLALPQDELMRAQIAQLLGDLGVSKLTIFDQILELQDPHGEYERGLNEQADQDPVIKAMNMAKALAQAKKPQLANWVLTAYVQPALNAMQQGPKPATPSPEIQPPESRGQLEQHEEFQTPPQNVSENAMAAMGAVLRR